MDRKKFAIITVNFQNNIEEKDLQEIENKLRQLKNVNNFSPNQHKLSFTIWSEGEIDYGIIDELKSMFKNRFGMKFSSVEYITSKTREF